MFHVHVLIICIKLLKEPTNALRLMNVILLLVVTVNGSDFIHYNCIFIFILVLITLMTAT
jgi:hypothetical protein